MLSRFTYSAQRGVSLIECLVAMTLNLIILSGLSITFIDLIRWRDWQQHEVEQASIQVFLQAYFQRATWKNMRCLHHGNVDRFAAYRAGDYIEYYVGTDPSANVLALLEKNISSNRYGSMLAGLSGMSCVAYSDNLILLLFQKKTRGAHGVYEIPIWIRATG